MLDIDLDKIATEIENVLDWYAIPYKHRVVRADIVDTWFNRKRALLETFSKHPNWDNDTCSVLFDTQYERPILVYDAMGRAKRLFNRHYALKHEKALAQGLALSHDDIVEELRIKRLVERESTFGPKINDQTQACWAEACPNMKEPYRQFPVGLRTSRAFARLFKHYGIDKMPDYEKHFAMLADAVSPLTISRTTALSFHPCDYLQMSHGTGWKSCHRIDGGDWQGGTWSYMLDEVTSILSTTEDDHGNMYNRPKVNRMVVCFDGGEILFSRLYPNYTDFAIRDTFRNVVQEIYAKCLDVPNLWQPPMRYNKYHSHYCDDDTLSTNFVTSGVGHMQYRDYDYAEYNCELSVLKGREPHVMEIGTWGICPVTGDEYDECGDMTSEGGRTIRCEHCGRRIHENDAYWDDCGYAYCIDCWDDLFSACECCGEYFRDTEMTETQDGCVCQRCLEENYVECCECGEWAHTDNAITDVDGHWYCEDCAEDNLTRCDDCGEYYHNDDITTFLHPVHGFVMDLCPDCYEQALEDAKNEEEVEVNA